MKNKFIRLMQRSAVLGALTLIALCSAGQLQAQLDPSVLGPAWDFTISGNARGIAHLTFNSDFTVTGAVHIITHKKSAGSSDDLDERGATDTGRSGSSTNSATSVTNFFGGANVEGQWGFDPVSHKVIGFLNEYSEIVTATSTNLVVNTLTFRGKLKSGTQPRFTLSGTGPLGRQTFQGVPLQALPDIGGAYAASGKRAGHEVIEFFTLVPLGQNIYIVTNGTSPGFTFSGEAILSARKQLSMVTASEGTNVVNITALVGSFSTNKLNGSFKGRDSRGSVSLKVFDQ
jgi:hypothetical protein